MQIKIGFNGNFEREGQGGIAYGVPRCFHSTGFARHLGWDRYRDSYRRTDIETAIEEMNQRGGEDVREIQKVIVNYKNNIEKL